MALPLRKDCTVCEGTGQMCCPEVAEVHLVRCDQCQPPASDPPGPLFYDHGFVNHDFADGAPAATDDAPGARGDELE